MGQKSIFLRLFFFFLFVVFDRKAKPWLGQADKNALQKK